MPRGRIGYLYVVLLMLTVGAYLPLWDNGFVDLDDELYITANPDVIQGLSWSGFKGAWTTTRGKYWQPLTWISLQFDAHFFSGQSETGRPILSPTAFHGENLFWHGASVLLLFGLWLRLTGARWRSFLVAALFAVHPMHVESVAWAVERKDVLSCFFGVLTLWAYVGYVERPSWQRYLGMAAVYALSLLAKPMLLTLPFVLLLLDCWPLGRWGPRASPPGASSFSPVRASPGRLVLEKVPLFLLATAVGIVTMLVRSRTGALTSWSVLPLSARLANAASAYGWYLSHTFYPGGLAALYPHPLTNWSVQSALAGVGTLLALTLLTLSQARQRPWLIVGWLWFVGTLVPVIGLAQGGEQAWADRFSYWPHIGLFVATAWGLGEVVERLRLPALVCGAAGALVLGCLGVLTWAQVSYWRDTETLWERVLAVTEAKLRAHLNLGKYYQDQGHFDRAASHFGEAVRLQPASLVTQHFLGVALLSLGKLEEAEGHIQAAVELSPNYADAWYNLGVVRLRLGKPDEAIPCFRKVLAWQPGSADVLAVLGLALAHLGKRDEAVRCFQSALERNPAEAEAWRGLGIVALAQGQLGQAVQAFGRALQFNPNQASACSDLGLALGRQGYWGHAAVYHRKAIRLQQQAGALLAQMNGRIPAPDGIPPGVTFQCRLAYALHQVGDPLGATESYRSAYALDPYWPSKFLAKAWVLATHPDSNRRDLDLAWELTTQTIQGAGIASIPAAGDTPPGILGLHRRHNIDSSLALTSECDTLPIHQN